MELQIDERNWEEHRKILMKDRRERWNKTVNKKIVQTKKGEDIKLTILSVYNYYIYIS